MELELGFKISKTLDDYSSADLRISKDPRAGPIFVSSETDTTFFLTAHLKGYKKEHVQVEINEDGTRIAISGEKTVQEMVMINWQMHKKEPEPRRFRKAFNIPEGVNLDKIKARFIESNLTIAMPKLVKGLRGSKIVETTEEGSSQKENENLAKDNDEIVSEPILSKENENGERTVDEARDSVQKENENVAKENDEIAPVISPSKENGNGEREVEANDVVSEEIRHMESEKRGLESDNLPGKNIVDQEEEGKSVVEQQENEERQSNEKESKLCVPMIAGTAFIVSIIVFVMHMIRAKNAPTRKKS